MYRGGPADCCHAMRCCLEALDWMVFQHVLSIVLLVKRIAESDVAENFIVLSIGTYVHVEHMYMLNPSIPTECLPFCSSLRLHLQPRYHTADPAEEHCLM